jgi:5-methyltetrahydrofolate--homocysteine methyltransferase
LLAQDLLKKRGPTIRPGDSSDMNILEQIGKTVKDGNPAATKRLVGEALSQGVGPWSILNEGMVPALNSFGEGLKNGTIGLPEVMISVGALRAGLTILNPLLVPTVREQRGVVLIGTVEGDVHSLGKELVVVMLEGNGYQVIDLGTDVPARRFAEATARHRPDVLAMSGLLTSSRLTMKSVISILDKQGLREQVSILVGGGCVDAETAKGIGADAYEQEASVAPATVSRLLKRKV